MIIKKQSSKTGLNILKNANKKLSILVIILVICDLFWFDGDRCLYCYAFYVWAFFDAFYYDFWGVIGFIGYKNCLAFVF